MTSYSFRLRFPPSVNAAWRSRVVKGAAYTYHTAKGKTWRRQAVEDIKETLVAIDTIAGRVAVSLDLSPPTKRKCDIDNYAKAVLDAIEASGLIENDSQVDVLHIERMPVEGYCDVIVTEIEETL